MKVASFDLETIACKQSLKLLPPVEVKPHGSIKDPIKIEKDIAAKTKKAEEERTSKAGLNPATAKICCFGWATKKSKTDNTIIKDSSRIIESNHLILKDETPQSEKKLLQDAWEVLNEFDHYTTFNGYGFDVPVLLMRSAIHRVRPSVNISTKKYNIFNHTDSRMVFGGWDKFTKGKLPFYSQLLLSEKMNDEFTGEDVQMLWDMELYSDIFDHCEEDCRQTYKLYEIVASYYLS